MLDSSRIAKPPAQRVVKVLQWVHISGGRLLERSLERSRSRILHLNAGAELECQFKKKLGAEVWL